VWGLRKSREGEMKDMESLGKDSRGTAGGDMKIREKKDGERDGPRRISNMTV